MGKALPSVYPTWFRSLALISDIYVVLQVEHRIMSKFWAMPGMLLSKQTSEQNPNNNSSNNNSFLTRKDFQLTLTKVVDEAVIHNSSNLHFPEDWLDVHFPYQEKNNYSVWRIVLKPWQPQNILHCPPPQGTIQGIKNGKIGALLLPCIALLLPCIANHALVPNTKYSPWAPPEMIPEHNVRSNFRALQKVVPNQSKMTR